MYYQSFDMSTVHVLSKFLLIVNLIFKIVNSFEDMQYKICYTDFKYFCITNILSFW